MNTHDHPAITNIRPIWTNPLAKRTTLELAHLALIQRIASLCVPRIRHGEADAADLRNLASHLTELADAVDSYTTAVGREAKSTSTYDFDESLFERPLFTALDGNAIGELHTAADQWVEENGQFGMGA